MKIKSRKIRKESYKSTHGITLITLVITIILLIILAGVVINISLGENGIFTRAKQAKEKYNESVAREKIEMVLIDAVTEKQVNPEYNKDEFLDDMLNKSGIEVDGDNVIVDDYNFTIDRENLRIEKSLGELQIKVSKEVKKYLGKNSNNKYEAEILIVIESNTTLQKIEIIKPDGTVLEVQTEKEKVAKDLTVEFDEEYILKITDKSGKTENRKVVEKTEETIRTAEELVSFRDKVNSGLTYEGKVIKQVRDISLNTVCNSEIGTWIPIGNNIENCFKGTYDGNNKKLEELYIYYNTVEGPTGLFGILGYTGTIKNLTVTGNIQIIDNPNEYAIGTIVGRNEGIIENVANRANIITESNNIGGIVGNNLNKVIKCTNSGNISSSGGVVGGICGISSGSITTANVTEDIVPMIKQCRNTAEATVTGTEVVGGILGQGETKIYMGQCYNAGVINGSTFVGGIAGFINNGDGEYGHIGNCYNTGDINATESRAGGLVGGIASANKEIGNSYNIGKITCPQYAGGVIGENKGALYNLYYLNKGGVTYGCGINNSSTGLEEGGGSTEETLKSLAKKFNDYSVSYGNPAVWKNDETNINNGYPILEWQVEE